MQGSFDKALKAQKRKAEAKSDRKESIRAETKAAETKKGKIEGEVCGKIHKRFGTESAD